jgi:Domain of unknown function (DUF4440)
MSGWANLVGVAFLATLLHSSCSAPRPPSPTEDVRRELIEARERAWRAFFQSDPAALEAILGPEVIAIQQSAEEWERRPRLLALARAIDKQGVRILRLEFPHTEIQLFGDTAILYYTYLFETGSNGRSATDSGRGTEVFVRRDGRWVDVGWHLDNGAFVRKDGQWIRTGGPSAN